MIETDTTDTPETPAADGYYVVQLGARAVPGQRAMDRGGPTLNAALGVEIMHQRVTLWNRLVDVDHQWQQAVRAVVAEHAPDVVATAEAVLAADAPADRRAASMAYGAAWKAARADAETVAALDAAEQDRRAAVKQATADSGLHWLQTDSVLAAYRRAHLPAIDAFSLLGQRHPRGWTKLPPRFHAWRTERGALTARYQTGLPASELLAGTDTRARLDPVPADAWTHPQRGERKRLQRTTLHVRIGSDERRGPVWLSLPVVLHRPLPDGAIIRTVGVYREMIGTHARWSACLTMSVPAVVPIANGHGAVGVDVGWRRRPDGLRVAVWVDDLGETGELLLPNAWLAAMQQVDNLQSIRRDHLNEALAALIAWKLERGTDLPDWWREATATLAQWQSAARLAALVLRWRDARFAGDETIYADLEQWRHHDRHLLEYEANLRDQTLDQRRHVYRTFAAHLTRRYQIVRVEAFNQRQMQRTPPPGEPDEVWQAVRHQHTLAAISTLRLAVENAAKRDGVTVEAVPAEHTTQTCAACGAAQRFDAATELRHTCTDCGAEWDQDENAARWIVRGGVPQTTEQR